jgi:hypothetical protein
MRELCSHIERGSVLQCGHSLRPELGSIAEVHYETRDAGQALNDLMLVLRWAETTKCGGSVKSDRQLTSAGFNGEFVQGNAWDQRRGAAGLNFDPVTDILCLVIGVIDDPVVAGIEGAMETIRCHRWPFVFQNH